MMSAQFFKDEPITIKQSVTNESGMVLDAGSVAKVTEYTEAGDPVYLATWDNRYTFKTTPDNVVTVDIKDSENTSWWSSGPDCFVLHIYGTHIMRLDNGLWYLFDDMEPFMRVQLVADLDAAKAKAMAYYTGEDDE
jgi:hypothetical protein